MPRSRARIALIKRPINQAVEKHCGGARAHHADKDEQQDSERRPAIRGDNQCAECERQREDGVRKPDEPKKSPDRSARHAHRLSLSILQAHWASQGSRSDNCRKRALAPERKGVPCAKSMHSTSRPNSFRNDRHISFWFRQYFRGGKVKPYGSKLM